MSLPPPNAIALWDNDEGAQAPLAVVTVGPFMVSKQANGAVRGTAKCDVAGTFDLIFEQTPGASDSMIINVPQDPALLTAFHYPFLVAIFMPFVSFRFTVGAGAAAFLRGFVNATPYL